MGGRLKVFYSLSLVEPGHVVQSQMFQLWFSVVAVHHLVRDYVYIILLTDFAFLLSVSVRMVMSMGRSNLETS